MWVLGDWGQSEPWQRTNGVKMVKDENNVWTGKLTLPKGTKFEIQTMKSTVSTTSGGVNKWSATRYKSVLNTPASYDFGEFTANLVPNGDFDEGQVKWTPAEAIRLGGGVFVQTSPNALRLGGNSGITSCSSDVFTIPPGQKLRLSGYVINFNSSVESTVAMEIVSPQQQTLVEFGVKAKADSSYHQFSKMFESLDVPIDCRITLSNAAVGKDDLLVGFDSLSLVSV